LDAELANPKKEDIVVRFIYAIITKFEKGEVCLIDPLDPSQI
jgi:hypothetical protein